MGFWSKLISFITPPSTMADEVAKTKVIKKAMKDATVHLDKFKKPVVTVKPKRAKSTPDVNEAWVGGKAPKKKAVKKKPAKKVVRITTDNIGE